MGSAETIETLLATMVELGASDLILVPGAPATYKVRLRFQRPTEKPLSSREVQEYLERIISPEDMRTFEAQGQVDFAVSMHGHRFRVNAYRQRGMPAMVFRAIPLTIPCPEDLGLPEKLLDLAQSPKGLILITGPTGSGKSTTLAAIIGFLAQRGDLHIVTIEDPIEYYFPSGRSVISQREVGRDTPGFAEALRVVLRQAPNVIMIGEMRDRETVAAALTAAETGHLVLATLHTTSAAQTVERIVDFFDGSEKSFIQGMLASTLVATFTQRLLPTVDGGVVLAYELMVVTPAIAALIRDGKVNQIGNYISSGKEDGMISMEQRIRELVGMGLINSRVGYRLLRKEAAT